MADPTVTPQPAPVPNKPEFADNREVTLADALCAHLDWLESTYAKPTQMCIATGYFNPEGFAVLADRIEKLDHVNLLLGAEPMSPPVKQVRMPGEPSGARFEEKQVSAALGKQAAGLEQDRNLMEFTRGSDRAVQRLLAFLATGKITVKRYEKAFMHGKAFLFATDNEGVIAGSSNFTAAGLTRNLELNLGRYDPTPVEKVKKWFDGLWEDAVPYDLAKVYAPRYEAYPPYLIFLRVLWERYKSEIEDEKQAQGGVIRLTTFQNDGIARAHRILERYNGVLICDGVGLGKTFVGGEILRRVIQDQRQRALLIAPAALRDGTWQRFRDRFQLYIETISYEELANESLLGGGSGRYLKQHPNDYALVVIDEAQAFRNPDAFRSKALRQLLQGKPPKKLVLMSATPVNNSLWDLYYLLTFFARQDATFADLGIRSMKQRFADAMKAGPDDLSPDVLFDVLDATTVRRTRHFIQRFYPNDRITGPDGTEMPIRFPDPHVERAEYSLDGVMPGFFDEFENALAPEDPALPLLTLARYIPSRYKTLHGEEDLREAALLGLLRSGLLKRFESSAFAFHRTAQRMADACDTFLKGLSQGLILTSDGIEEWQQTDNDELFDGLFADADTLAAQGYDVDALRRDVTSDRNLLHHFAERAGSVTRATDPKLAALVEQLVDILERANVDGLDEADKRNKRKVIIFSFFGDTVDWIHEHLVGVFAADRRLAEYRGRLASVKGDESYEGVSREGAIFGFVPESSEAPAGRTDDLFDVLVTTDVLSEGMNLQQCRNIINYDLPWNPMRLVQRHGRVDRIGSPHRDVYMKCFFPDARLGDLLELETRIRGKLAQAAASVGVENEVIPGAATNEINFSDERAEIERLRNEDPTILVNGGEDPSAHSGEEYRQELRKGLELYGDQIKAIPWGSGSGFANGKRAGQFFCAYVGERLFLRFVPDDGSTIVSDTLGCLRLITCTETTERIAMSEVPDAVYSAWAKARHDIFSEWAFSTDPANLQPRIRPALKAAADHLRMFPPAGMNQDKVNELIESLEAPWGVRIEKQIRDAVESQDRQDTSTAIAEAVIRLGLEPFKAPEPLPPIEETEVLLVCWMQVTSTP